MSDTIQAHASWRAEAEAAAARLGVPSRKIEAWRWTPTNKLSGLVAAAPAAGAADEAAVNALLEGRAFDGAAAILTFTNGRFDAERSRLPGEGSGLQARSLADALADDPERIGGLLGRAVSADHDGPTARNTASFIDGALIEVARNHAVEGPVVVSFVTTATADGDAPTTYPRLLVSAAPSSEVTIVEAHVGPDGLGYGTNAVTEVLVEPNASVRHVLVQEQGDASTHLSGVHADQKADGRFDSHVVSLGGAIARVEVQAALRAPGAHVGLQGLYVGDGAQRLDHYTCASHLAPHTTSSELYKGIVDGKSTGSFQGVVRIHEGASKSASEQLNRNLVLSDSAQVNTKPQLEIDNDDVTAAHGATVGQLDQAALFYFQSRGISKALAERLLLHAFAQEIVERLPAQGGMRARLAERVDTKLGPVEGPGGAA